MSDSERERTNLVCEICGINYIQRGLLCKPASEGNAHKWKSIMSTHDSRESEDDFGENKNRQEKIEEAAERIKKLKEEYKERCKIAHNMYRTSILYRVKMWKHVKTNNIYTVLGMSICSTNGEQNGKKSVVYMNSEGEMFNRDTVEFLDGRFEPMNSIALKSLN